MKIFLAFSILCIFALGQSIRSVRPYCLEELKGKYASNVTISQHYVYTGEANCFSLKTHVAKCLDMSLLQLIRTVKPETVKDKTKIPSIAVPELENALSHYINLKRLPLMKTLLKNCGHEDSTRDSRDHVIVVGDFSKRCDCDFGGHMHCLAYEHVRTVFSCGRVEEVVPVQ